MAWTGMAWVGVGRWWCIFVAFREEWVQARLVGAADFARDDFIKSCTRWEVSCQKKMTVADATIAGVVDKLVSDFPARFKPESAVGDLNLKEAKCAISDMVNAHLGEMREIDGEWVPLQAALDRAGLVVDSIPSQTEERSAQWMGGRVHFNLATPAKIHVHDIVILFILLEETSQVASINQAILPLVGG